jgi:hypothetical protein
MSIDISTTGLRLLRLGGIEVDNGSIYVHREPYNKNSLGIFIFKKKLVGLQLLELP